MMNRLEPLFQNGTGRRKGTPKGVGEIHQWQIEKLILKYDKLMDVTENIEKIKWFHF